MNEPTIHQEFLSNWMSGFPSTYPGRSINPTSPSYLAYVDREGVDFNWMNEARFVEVE